MLRKVFYATLQFYKSLVEFRWKQNFLFSVRNNAIVYSQLHEKIPTQRNTQKFIIFHRTRIIDFCEPKKFIFMTFNCTNFDTHRRLLLREMLSSGGIISKDNKETFESTYNIRNCFTLTRRVFWHLVPFQSNASSSCQWFFMFVLFVFLQMFIL